MVEERNGSKLPSQWWWWSETQKNNSCKIRTPWLQSTLDELDERTNAMLRIIEGDADSFARRAEMFYKKRPELISMVQDFYKAHRLLAEGYDQLKSESGARMISPWQLPHQTLSFKCQAEHSATSTFIAYDSHSESFELEESELSDVEDPEEAITNNNHQNGTEKVSVCNGEVLKLSEEIIQQARKGSQTLKDDMKRDEISSVVDNDEVEQLKEEKERLEEETRIQKELLEQKDEEKREAIRQLSLAMDLLRRENASLRKSVCYLNAGREMQHPPKNEGRHKQGFWRKFLRGHPKSEIGLVTF
ncbi:unnamed protein product [Cuscuta campestris]|uniref:NAB domain-containing protein n=1 Tax=Cuscuta campestris TaxID=132261 RepID=A0A484LRJ7_9ASTE|nr:unnamed protein product [Cuscuta campestris]